MIEASEGQILVDGLDIGKLKLDLLRKSITIMSQVSSAY